MDAIRPALELAVMVPGVLLAYLPMRGYLRQPPEKLIRRMLPLLLLLSLAGGFFCRKMQLATLPVMFALLPCIMIVYVKTLRVSAWKSVSVALSVCAVFACINSLSRAFNAALAASQPPTKNELWFRPGAGLFDNAVCWLFVLLAWRPASHAARSLVEDDNFAETWYVFWLLPLVFIGLNVFMIPRYRGTLYTGRILQGYVVISLTLLLLLVLFYALFFMMASSLSKNARLQQENHFLSMQRARYDNLRAAIDEARQARHDLRHHFNRLAALAEVGDLAQIQAYLTAAAGRIPSLNMHFCDNSAADSVIGHYCALAEREGIPFHARIDLPAKLPVEEIDLCLVLSNLLENALEANLRMSATNRQIDVEAYMHADHLLLIQVVNPFDGEIREKHAVFQSSKRKGDGVGIQSVRRICEKNGGASTFSHEDGIFTVKVMLRG